LSPEKGAAEAIEIARKAGIPIDLYGDAYDPEYAAAMVSSSRAVSGVSIHSGVAREVLWRVMGRAAAVLCPAKWDEPFGLVAAEAQATGTPVVAFRRGALEEVVVDGETGFLASPGDVDGAAQAVTQLAAAIRESGGTATAAPGDLSRADDVNRVFAIADGLGGATALVCAAAVLSKVPFIQTTLETWEQTLATNLTGMFLCCRAAFRSMRTAGGGRIVNLASLSGVYGTEKFPGLAAYNVSKYGVIGLTEAIAVEGREYGI